MQKILLMQCSLFSSTKTKQGPSGRDPQSPTLCQLGPTARRTHRRVSPGQVNPGPTARTRHGAFHYASPEPRGPSPTTTLFRLFVSAPDWFPSPSRPETFQIEAALARILPRPAMAEVADASPPPTGGGDRKRRHASPVLPPPPPGPPPPGPHKRHRREDGGGGGFDRRRLGPVGGGGHEHDDRR
jgi:hypothetical protein